MAGSKLLLDSFGIASLEFRLEVVGGNVTSELLEDCIGTDSSAESSRKEECAM